MNRLPILDGIPSAPALALRALCLAAAAFAAASLALVLAATSGAGVAGAIVARGLGALAAVAVAGLSLTRRTRVDGVGFTLLLLVAYTLDPYTWSARGAAAGVLTLAWPATVLLDALAWLAAGWLGRWMGMRASRQRLG